MEKARTLDLLGFISNGMKVSAKKKYIWDQMKTEELYPDNLMRPYYINKNNIRIVTDIEMIHDDNIWNHVYLCLLALGLYLQMLILRTGEWGYLIYLAYLVCAN